MAICGDSNDRDLTAMDPGAGPLLSGRFFKQGIRRNLILEFIDLSAHSGIFSGVQRKTLDPSLRRDDGGNFTVATTTTVIPA
jgi:hypothetical protein